MDDVHKVERQVVAGMNYRVTVSLKSTCVIPGGARESVIRCEKVKVFKPLPFSCNSPNPDNPKCMELTEADMSEKCSSDRELPSPPLPGGFSELAEAGSDPDVGHVMNFIASEVKNSIFQVDLSKGFLSISLSIFTKSEMKLNLVNRVKPVRSRWTAFTRWRGKLWPA